VFLSKLVYARNSVRDVSTGWKDGGGSSIKCPIPSIKTNGDKLHSLPPTGLEHVCLGFLSASGQLRNTSFRP
jgi:hypothetical protein